MGILPIPAVKGVSCGVYSMDYSSISRYVVVFKRVVVSDLTIFLLTCIGTLSFVISCVPFVYLNMACWIFLTCDSVRQRDPPLPCLKPGRLFESADIIDIEVW